MRTIGFTASLLLMASLNVALPKGVVTISCISNQTNQVQIGAQQTAKIKTYWDACVATPIGGGFESHLEVQTGGHTLNIPVRSILPGWGSEGIEPGSTFANYVPDFMIAGPATVRLVTPVDSRAAAILTLDVEPGPYPPGKTATVGAYSGNVQVTMEMSTDLVNWTPAVNGMVYTNSPDARFFRIRLLTNATP